MQQNLIKSRHGLKFVLSILAVFSVFNYAHAEEYVNDYEKTPKLKIFYGNRREKKFPINVHELMPFKISGKSYTQEFDFKITAMKGGSTHLCLGIHRGLTLYIFPKGRIQLFARGIGYVAKAPNETLESNIDYSVKISYNKTTLTGQCVVLKKNDNSVVWDTGKKLCDPLAVGNIHFKARHFKKDPANSKSEIFWNEQEQVMTLCSAYKAGILKVNVDNMKITIQGDN